jgi:hypothetical protein
MTAIRMYIFDKIHQISQCFKRSISKILSREKESESLDQGGRKELSRRDSKMAARGRKQKASLL